MSEWKCWKLESAKMIIVHMHPRARWGSSGWEGSPPRESHTLSPNLRCLAGYLFMEKAAGVNPEEKSGVGVPKPVCCCSQCHFQQFLWHCWCTVSALPFLWIHQQFGVGNRWFSISPYPGFHPGPDSVEQTQYCPSCDRTMATNWRQSGHIGHRGLSTTYSI